MVAFAASVALVAFVPFYTTTSSVTTVTLFTVYCSILLTVPPLVAVLPASTYVDGVLPVAANHSS